MTRVKICGITRKEDIKTCVAAGVHALGFVVEYPHPVPWNLERKEAEILLNQVPPFVSRVVVVGDEEEKVLELAEKLKPHAVQLHGNEPINVTEEMVKRLQKMGIQAIKALRIHTETGTCLGEKENPLEMAQRIEQTGVDALLLDSVSKNRPAGTGEKINWDMARQIRNSLKIPVILAGGLTPENVRQAVEVVAPYGVDVITGVEKTPGEKDPQRVRAFIEALRG